MSKTRFIQPDTIQEAETRIAEITDDIKRIQSQLAEAALVLEDRAIPWEDPKKKERKRWRARAVYAINAKEGELTKIKTWLKHERENNKLVAVGLASSDDPIKDALAQMYQLVKNLKVDGVELNDEELKILDSVEILLGLT